MRCGQDERLRLDEGGRVLGPRWIEERVVLSKMDMGSNSVRRVRRARTRFGFSVMQAIGLVEGEGCAKEMLEGARASQTCMC